MEFKVWRLTMFFDKLFYFKQKIKNVREDKTYLNKESIKRYKEMDIDDLLRELGSSYKGLNEEGIERSIERYGINKISKGKRKNLFQEILDAFISPFTMILMLLVIVSTFTDIIFPLKSLFGRNPGDVDFATVIIIITMVMISGLLKFFQEKRSGNVAEKLMDLVSTKCRVVRDDKDEDIPFENVCVGDIVKLSQGDMLPADVRIIEAGDFFVNQSSISGESEPVEKAAKKHSCFDGDENYNMAFMGSSVVSGSAIGVVTAVGDKTLFGSIAKTISKEEIETSFTKGINSVSMILLKFMSFMAPTVFILNGITKGNWMNAFLFAISIAVGLTPEMLPMIVTTSLSKGAVSMSRKKTIVKNLNAIQNFGSMEILCTDKTGTLTQDKVVLQFHLDINGNEDMRVLRHAYLNSYFQTGYKNLMDLAIIKKTEDEENKNPDLIDLSEHYKKIDEIPFDFTRRRLTTVVEDLNKKRQMLTKGAVEEMLAVCSFVEVEGKVCELNEELTEKIKKAAANLNKKGFRVLLIAQKNNLKSSGGVSIEDEKDMVLMGYLAFLDPPKESAASAIKSLKEYGVSTKILTGDNEKVTRTVCDQVGIEVNKILLGSDIENMSKEELRRSVNGTDVFAKLSPDQKASIVEALRENGHSVGFMGDGINDAAAMKKADIAVSVDSAVDIAKETADIILLEKDLTVLKDGIIEGRKTYTNMIKYIKMTASSNFGNVFSVLAASALLPFLPMRSLQLLFLNLVYDISCSAIPWDNVDRNFILKPVDWDASSIARFMVYMGPISSLFDFITFAFLYFIICPMFVSNGVLFHDLAKHFSSSELLTKQIVYTALFQTGWFVESMWSQTLVIHMIRTEKIPFIQSRASFSLTVITSAAIAVITSMPFTPLGKMLGFVKLPNIYFFYLIPCIVFYMVLVTVVKITYIKKYKKWL